MSATFHTLARQGRASATWRGHEMPPLRKTRLSDAHSAWSTQCRHCHAFLQINPNPYPNEIEIGGSAVALTCPGAKNGGAR